METNRRELFKLIAGGAAAATLVSGGVVENKTPYLVGERAGESLLPCDLAAAYLTLASRDKKNESSYRVAAAKLLTAINRGIA